jgi:hypothetical protein
MPAVIATDVPAPDAEIQRGQTNGRHTEEPPPIVSVASRKHAGKRNVAGSPGSSGTFLGMPTMNLNMDTMDVRKWGWRGALTFGKAQGKKPPANPETKFEEGQSQREGGEGEDAQKQTEGEVRDETTDDKRRPDLNVDVDTTSLMEAMDTIHIRDSLWKPEDTDAFTDQQVVTAFEGPLQDSTSAEQTPVQTDAKPFSALSNQQTASQEPLSRTSESLQPTSLDADPDPHPAALELLSASIHVPLGSNPLVTCRKKLLYTAVSVCPFNPSTHSPQYSREMS